MDPHAAAQAKFLSFAILGVVGLILVLIHAYAAFAPSLEDDFWDFRSPIARPVGVIEFVWSLVTLVAAVTAAGGRAGPAALAGLLAVLVALFLLVVSGGARNWPAGTLIIFVLFWGAFALELGLGHGRRLLVRHVAPTAAGAAWGPAGYVRAPPRDPEAAPFAAASASQAGNVTQGPPPYENSPLLPGRADAVSSLAHEGKPGNSAKPVGE